MVRNFMAALLVTLGVGTVASAADYAGKITKFDSDTRTVTVHVANKNQTLVLAKDCKIYKLKGKGKKAGYDEDPDGLKDVVAGAVVTASTDFVDGNDVVTLLKIKSLPRKKN